MRKFKKILKIAAGICCAVCLAAGSVEAAQASVGVSLLARQRLEDGVSRDAGNTFTYVLKAAGAENPMPGGVQADSYSFSIAGKQDIELEEMIYTKPGTYRYEVYQNIPAEKKGWVYDDKRYSIEVCVRNTAVGMEAAVVILNEKGEKCESLSFVNQYKDSPSPNRKPPEADTGKPVKTGDAADPGLWICLALGSGGAILSAAALKRKRENG